MDIENHVAKILEEIKQDGKSAVKKYSKKFDDYEGPLKVEDAKIRDAEIPEEDKIAIDRAIDRIRKHHQRQKRTDELYQERGSMYGLVYRPIERVGIYVPGGKSLISSLIMCAIPAKIAGVEDIAIATPPNKDGLSQHFLYTAKTLGVSEIYSVGGVQAIGAMAYGVGMEKVDKIFGPGNEFVNEAKKQLFGKVGIDSLAGPSEICIIADDSADKELVISDLKAQMEHGVSSKAWLLTTSEELKRSIDAEENGIKISFKQDINECIDKANEIAPEHLQINTEEPLKLTDKIKNAGAIYLGEYTPAAAADYFLGVNHVLPTGKAARFDSVLNVMDFMKTISFASIDKEEFLKDVDIGVKMAEIEDMTDHKKSLEERK